MFFRLRKTKQEKLLFLIYTPVLERSATTILYKHYIKQSTILNIFDLVLGLEAVLELSGDVLQV